MPRKSSILYALCALASFSPASMAETEHPASVAVAPSGCAGLDVLETERLLRTELAVVAARAERVRTPVVQIACGGSSITVRLYDEVARRTISETMPAPPADQPGRERVIALAASQLFLSSWLEVLRREEPSPPVESAAAEAPAPARRDRTRRPLSLRAGLGLDARAHGFDRPLVGVLPRFEFGLRAGLFRAAVHGSAERARATRTTGDITLVAVGGGASAGVEVGTETLRWTLLARASAYALRAMATARDDGRAHDARGSVFEASLSGGPMFFVAPRTGVALLASFGAVLPEAVARVDGDRDVRLDGWFAGLGVGASYDFGGAP